MDYNSKNELTMDFTEDARAGDKTTAVLRQLIEIGNFLSNHLGSHIDPSDKKITGKAKTPAQVDVGRMAQKPLTESQQKTAGAVYKNRQMPTRDYTGRIISKDDADDELSLARFREDEEKLNPAITALSMLDNEEKAMANPLSTSEGKALLSALNEAANKLRAFLSTTRVDASSAQMPQDMR